MKAAMRVGGLEEEKFAQQCWNLPGSIINVQHASKVHKHHATVTGSCRDGNKCLPQHPLPRPAQLGLRTQHPTNSPLQTLRAVSQSHLLSFVPYLRPHELRTRNVPFLALLSSGISCNNLRTRDIPHIFPSLRFAGFLLSCVGISLAAARGRGIKTSAALLGVV